MDGFLHDIERILFIFRIAVSKPVIAFLLFCNKHSQRLADIRIFHYI